MSHLMATLKLWGHTPYDLFSMTIVSRRLTLNLSCMATILALFVTFNCLIRFT